MRKSILLYAFICALAVLLASAQAEETETKAAPPAPPAPPAVTIEDQLDQDLEDRELDVARDDDDEERDDDEQREAEKREADDDNDQDEMRPDDNQYPDDRERDDKRHEEADDDDEREGDDDRNVRHASAVILVTSNPRTFALEPGAIQHLLSETDWIRKDDLEMEIHFEPLPCGREGSVIGILHVEQEGDEEIDPKLMGKISDRLQAVLTTLAKATIMEPFEFELKSARRRAEEAGERVNMLSHEAQEIGKRFLREGIVPDEMGAHIAMLQRERFQMQVELAGLRARHETLMPRIARTAEKMEKAKAQALSGLKGMEAAIQLYTKDLDRRLVINKKVAGSVPQSEIEEAEAELLMAKAELETRRHEINREYGGGMLAPLNEQAVQAEVERKSVEARLEMIERRIEQFQNKELLELVGNYRQITMQLEEARRRREATRNELAELKSEQSRLQFPRVRILRPAELIDRRKK